ncbi:MAG: peptidoglycan-binding protein [Clostridia bacterium]|nr:peptidoglycan-binding protein [Clostridia bacterium]
MNRNLPVIPEIIRVHLGAPSAEAENVSVSFPDYIKNVASSEIFPTWPESALRANILAQISFALNRVYTEYYPSRGYDFDITNNTAFDQSFVKDRDIFENISAIVDEIFNNYIVRAGNVEPLFATYCNGTTTTCEGLSQWGTVDLANEGLGAYDILTRFYGDDISLVTNAPVAAVEPSEPEVLLRLGSAGNDVAFIQLRLNRISSNYPSIPKIPDPDGIFGVETENSVRQFQRIFNLAPDGIVGKATWYRIQFIYNAVKKLNELQSEGLRLEDVSKQFPEELSFGDTGDNVELIQYFLTTISTFNEVIPDPGYSGVFDERTRNSVLAFQRFYGLPPTGTITDATWNYLYDDYLGIVRSLTPEQIGTAVIPFPGNFLRLGSTGDDVFLLQEFINTAAAVYPSIPEIPVTGVFDEATRDAVYAVEETFGYPVNGIVGAVVWNELANIYNDVESGAVRSDGQFSGTELQEEGGDGV